MNRRTVLMLGLGAATAGLAHAQGKLRDKLKDGWEYLGEANVDGRVDHDRITVGRDDGVFRAIQIRVERAPIEFNRVVVHYGNGGDDTIQLRETIRAGGQTRAINLNGARRAIRSVELWYEKARLGAGRPRLTLYGRP